MVALAALGLFAACAIELHPDETYRDDPAAVARAGHRRCVSRKG